ncbi:MAG: sulfite exporter TauE/SafE family protein, partial [Hyphomicrobiales bacterium]|nr:sulfite exporter TauE/SafE family protein [Hyphomicrobiales bacterium]
MGLTGDALALACGGLVGFTLGLIGGGGSILAVPMLVYVVGVADPHVAIGTGALAVAASAFVNLVNHARAGNVKWNCGLAFAGAGVVGAWLGAALGKAVDGKRLLLLFGFAMIAVAATMLRRRSQDGKPDVRLHAGVVHILGPRLAAAGFGVGALSGFFGIGGGFLVVPGLMASTDMPLMFAIGTSLVSVTAFGLTTAASYALSGWVDWTLAALFVAGGAAGGFVGAATARRLSGGKRALS